MKAKTSVLTLLFSALTIAAVAPRCLAQAVTATLVGTVTDQTGSVIPNALVSITNIGTSTTNTANTNESGNYNFTLLLPGSYSITVTSSGFQKKITSGVNVPVNTTTRVDVSLTLGSASQTVTVTDQAPLLQTDRADVSAQIDAQQVVNLPVGNSQNFQQLESLIPGVSAPIYDHSAFFDAQNAQSFQVNGQSELSNNLQIEGIDDNQRTGLTQVYIPPAAAIQTIDTETSNYAPEFGRSAGAVTNVILKSGTNAFHGSAYEFNQVSALEARNYFNKTAPLPRQTDNYYGAAVGGPIVKNNTFFFGDLLRHSNYTSAYTLVTVPTADFRAGNLSASPTPIYDPQTGNPDGTDRQQFPGNMIKSTRISTIATNILALIPLPNVPGAGVTNNFQASPQFNQSTTKFDIKLDHTLRAVDHLAYRYSWERDNTFQQPIFGNAGGGPANGGFEGKGSNKVFNTALEYTHVFSSELFVEARAGIDHYRNATNPSGTGLDTATQLGIPGVNVDRQTSGAPGIIISGFSSPLIGYSVNAPWDRGETNIDFVNNWTKILGNHSIKFGFEVRRLRDDIILPFLYGTRGSFDFADGQTALNAPGQKTSFGNDFASFLLDLPNFVGRDVNVSDASWRQILYFAYLQDTWQATSKLTLTYGMRWEFYPPPNPRDPGGFSQYNPVTNSLEVAGYGSFPKNLGMNVNAKDFEPRIGLAFRATPRTVVRAGFGISHTPFQDSNYATNYPVRQNIAYSSLSSYKPAVQSDNVTIANMAGGFPAASRPAIPENGIIPNAPLSSSWITVNTGYKDPHVVSYNFTVQRDLGMKWTADVAYVGNQGRDIPGNYNLNAGLVAGAGAAGQPEFATFGRTASTELLPKQTSTNYNSLQVRLEHRISRSLISSSGYAWQKALAYNSTGGGLGGYSFYIDFKRNYARTNWDRSQTFVQSFVYSLPVGKGERFANSGIPARLLGNWQVSGLLTADTGTPLLLTASNAQLNAPSNTQVANEIKPFRKLHGIGTTSPWFDTSAFVQPTTVGFGNMGQNVYSGPALVTFDSSLQKAFDIHDETNLSVRVQAFNALNHPVFANPSTSLTSTSFGHVTSTLGSAGSTAGSRALQIAATLHF